MTTDNMDLSGISIIIKCLCHWRPPNLKLILHLLRAKLLNKNLKRQVEVIISASYVRNRPLEKNQIKRLCIKYIIKVAPKSSHNLLIQINKPALLGELCLKANANKIHAQNRITLEIIIKLIFPCSVSLPHIQFFLRHTNTPKPNHNN